jgi:LysR family transcriptional regulator, hydrogen peroxide-inducible genes activator
MLSGPHAFSLRQLQYIVSVADELSFRRAAARCRISQPSLSSQIAQVEDMLGVRLFERSRRQVIVSSVGRELVARARRLLQEADEIQQAALSAADPLSGTLRLGIVPTISPYLLPAVTVPLRKEFARLRIEWVEDKTEPLLRRLADGQLGGAIVALEADLGDVERQVIAKDPFFLATRPEHPLAASTSRVTAAELRGQELLLLEDGHCFREQALEVCNGSSAKEGEFRATSLSTLIHVIAGSGGATLLPAIAIDAEAKRARLHVRPLALSFAQRTIGLIWRRGSPERALLAVCATIRASYPRSTRPAPGRSRGKTARARHH